jgi:UDP-N-acetylglucosamine 4,6-dehydratase
MIDGQSVLITGGTGSFGTKFVETCLARHNPRRLIVYSRDEYKQFVMAQRVTDDRVRFFIGDVRDQDRLKMAMRGVDVVVHAAALKQVPTAEYNPMECVKTNIMGAENVVAASIAAGVKRVVALSTDKACNPINLYGATKLASDKIFVASNSLSGAGGTRFAIVRYGNVVGSRGSVIPFFKDLIEKGADHLPITDERMTRFWITLEQGVHFVLTSLEMMEGGELFVPKIPSMRIVDLAKVMAPSLPHKIVGIRPGEKLHEVMISEDDSRETVELADRYLVKPTFPWWTDKAYATSGKAVTAGFRYSSDSNSDWMDGKRLISMMKSI